MKKMKLTKKNKKELKMICGVLIFFAVIFIWIVQNIGLPIKTQVEKGRIKVIDISSYNGTVNWKKVKDHNINHVNLIPISAMQDMHQFTEAFIIILMRRQPVMQKKKPDTA